MSATPLTPEDRSALAAEYVLGLATGDDLKQARDLFAKDAEFQQEVGDWAAKLAPLIDEFAPVEAPAGLLQRVERNIGFLDSSADSAILHRSRNRWRAMSLAASAIAASLAIVLVTRPPDVRYLDRPAAADPMFAMLGDEKAPMKLVAAWNPTEKRLTVTPASEPAADPTHSYELWIIPPNGKPRSLGTLPTEGAMRGPVAPSIVAMFGEGATIAISVEPSGGSPTGQPTGPVIAAGKLQRT